MPVLSGHRPNHDNSLSATRQSGSLIVFAGIFNGAASLRNANLMESKLTRLDFELVAIPSNVSVEIISASSSETRIGTLALSAVQKCLNDLWSDPLSLNGGFTP
jgi:hypothetical protein